MRAARPTTADCRGGTIAIRHAMPTEHSRRRSFERHVNFTIPILPIARLAEKRAALSRLVATPLDVGASSNPGCVVLPADSKCPRSFGNRQHVLLSALMTTYVLKARLQPSTDAAALSCHSLLHFKLSDRLWPSSDGQADSSSSNQLRGFKASQRRVVKLSGPETCTRLASSALSLRRDECLGLSITEHGQQVAWCLQRRAVSGLSHLFALGPHAAYGALFDAAFALRNASTPLPHDADEIRIAVHIRHFDVSQDGREGIEAFESAIRRAALAARRCVLLAASDRRQALHMLADVARRVGCRIMTSKRGEATRDYSDEHGEDVGEVVLRDVFLLAQGHVLVGTWSSTLTVLIQEIIAARSLGYPHIPTVTYCDTSLSTCMQPLPLLTEERNRWFLSISHAGGVRISSREALEHADEWAQLDARQGQSAAHQAAATDDGPKRACELIVRQSKKAQCKLGKSFGCYPGGRKMWVARGCRGRFKCTDSVLTCGFPRQSMQLHNCTCLVDDYDTYVWPTMSESVSSLKSVANSAQASTSPWLAAIISGTNSNARFLATASSAAAAGGVVQHVPAAMPSHYVSLGEMLRDLFGVADRRVMRLSAHEVGLLISHKRALEAIARANFAWGAVFEDDAYLHEAVAPSEAAYLLAASFTAADASASAKSGPPRPHPLLYIGGCEPRCDADGEGRNETLLTGTLGPGLLRAGRCRAYCTHAYALSRRHASTFFADVFDCHNGTSGCGSECEYRPCYMDWAMSRHFKRSGVSWIVGGGLRSRWIANHRGLFVQNRSAALGNNFSGTSLKKGFRWTNNSALVEEQSCAGQRNRERTSVTPHGVPQPLKKVLVSIKWSGRLGNLLFELAVLSGLVHRLKKIAPAEAVTFRLPRSCLSMTKACIGADLEKFHAVPINELFDQFPTARIVVRKEQDELTGFDSAYKEELAACEACKLRVEEHGANAYDSTLVRRLESWVESPPDKCTLGLVEIVGYFQSWRYFGGEAEQSLRSMLAAPISATQREADDFVASVRRRLRVAGSGYWKLVGVQVRLGDKAHDGYFAKIYASTSWRYYRAGMKELRAKLLGPGIAGVAFIVTAGGTMGNNSADVAEAREHLLAEDNNVSAGTPHVFFSTASSPYVDLAVLRKCDGLVIGSSTFGWWAAWLAELPEHHVVAPRHLFSPRLSRRHALVKGFRETDYFPPDWHLLDNRHLLDNVGTAGERPALASRHTVAKGAGIEDGILRRKGNLSKRLASSSSALGRWVAPAARQGSVAPQAAGCFLRIVGSCPGYDRRQYHSWWPAMAAGVPNREACARRQRSWANLCRARSATTATVEMRWNEAPARSYGVLQGLGRRR